MAKTPIDLYRQGNASSPRMDNVRPNRDIAIYEEREQVWVNATLGGGISTFANLKTGKNWWKLLQDTDIPTQLELINDHNDHWLWKPRYNMSLEEYKAALRLIGTSFEKVS
ncbi:hypothetical protein ACE1B6_26510 [Aerosakkonemataceae cyanobacterium BLCC-F154]|uniref:Tse2 ADP-ribosyltransferase toxin domain-containing protein n=1 Tax=Floridaenema fluviatile BLCC-F154 TaxID=3153640 RepID=A0ABV4YJZ4_9CYAN